MDIVRQYPNVTAEVISQPVNRDHILKIYPQMKNWERVAQNLTLTEADIEGIKEKARSDPQLMRLYVLNEWKNKCSISGDDTYKNLLEALVLEKCDSASAHRVCELLSSCHI